MRGRGRGGGADESNDGASCSSSSASSSSGTGSSSDDDGDRRRRRRLCLRPERYDSAGLRLAFADRDLRARALQELAQVLAEAYATAPKALQARVYEDALEAARLRDGCDVFV